MLSSASSRDPLDKLAEEFAERYRRGERPSLGEYIDRYPELADQIRELFPALVEMEQLALVEDPHTGPYVPKPGSVSLPRQLGEYRILREIGHGGMGLVYEAVQESLGRHVALKVLPLHGLLNPTQLERFRREARAAARLHHTNIVPVFGVGEDNGVHYYAMQFIQGHNLNTVLEEVRILRRVPGSTDAPLSAVGKSLSEQVAVGMLSGSFPLQDTAPTAEQPAPIPRIEAKQRADTTRSFHFTQQTETQYFRSVAQAGVQIAEALAYAHSQGVLHRDIKPSNLLLDLHGTVWITDFGLAKEDDSDALTNTGDLVGTLRFMAPERFEGHCDVRSEVYSVGITLYEMLTLRPAFGECDRLALLERIRSGHLPRSRPDDPRLPRDLETIVLKAMARDPAARYATAEALAEDLRRFLADRPIRARRATVRERTWRWCRRNPWVAGLSAAVGILLMIVAVGATGFALRLQKELNRVEKAEHEQTEQLFEAQLAEARARRYSARPGQRFKSLEALQKAAALARQLGKPPETFEELRNEALSALCLPDIDSGPEWETACPYAMLAFDTSGQRYVQVKASGHAYYCRLVEGKEERVAAFEVSGGRVPGEWHSADLRFLALGSAPRPGKPFEWLKLWRCDGPKAELVLEDRAGLCEGATAFRPDGRQLAVGHADGTVTVYDTETGKTLRHWQQDVPAYSAAFHPRLPRLAVTCGTEVRIYDVESGNLLPRSFNHPGRVGSVAWHPDGRRLAVGCSTRQIMLWDTETGRQLMPPLQGLMHEGIVVGFNAAGDRLLSRDWSSICRLWDVDSGRELFHMPALCDGLPEFSRDDRFLIVPYAEDRIRLYRFAAGREQRVLVSGTPSALEQEAWSLQHPRGWMMTAPLPIEGRCGIDASGDLLSRNTQGVFRWPVRVETGSPPRYHLGPPQRITANRAANAEGFGMSRDGSVLAFGHHNYATVVHSGQARRMLTLGPQYDIRRVAVSPDGRWVVTGSHFSDGEGEDTRIWDADTGKLVQVLPVEAPVYPSFSADGRWVHTLINAGHWFEVGSWTPKSVPCPPGLLEPGGRLLASRSGYGELRLLDFATAREIARLSIPDATRLDPLAFSPDGDYLFAVGMENDCKYRWDLRLLRRQLAELNLDMDLPSYPEPREQLPAWPPPEVIVHGGELVANSAKLGQWERLLAALAWHASPLDAEAHVQLGALALADKRWRAALVHLSIARALRPEDFEVRRLRARAALQVGQWAEALADAEWVLQHQADHLHALIVRSSALQQLGRHKDAIKDCTFLLRFYPHNAGLYEQRARSYLALNDPARAAADQKKAEQFAVRDALWLNNQAWELLTGPIEQRDPVRALRLAQQAVAQAPNAQLYLNTLGLAQYRNKLYREAVATLTRSLEAGQGHYDAFDLFFLAMTYHRLGNATQARDCYDRALKWLHDQKGLTPHHLEELQAFRQEADQVFRDDVP